MAGNTKPLLAMPKRSRVREARPDSAFLNWKCPTEEDSDETDLDLVIVDEVSAIASPSTIFLKRTKKDWKMLEKFMNTVFTVERRVHRREQDIFRALLCLKRGEPSQLRKALLDLRATLKDAVEVMKLTSDTVIKRQTTRKLDYFPVVREQEQILSERLKRLKEDLNGKNWPSDTQKSLSNTQEGLESFTTRLTTLQGKIKHM